jgi:hypothetical protein
VIGWPGIAEEGDAGPFAVADRLIFGVSGAAERWLTP